MFGPVGPAALVLVSIYGLWTVLTHRITPEDRTPDAWSGHLAATGGLWFLLSVGQLWEAYLLTQGSFGSTGGLFLPVLLLSRVTFGGLGLLNAVALAFRLRLARFLTISLSLALVGARLVSRELFVWVPELIFPVWGADVITAAFAAYGMWAVLTIRVPLAGRLQRAADHGPGRSAQ
jgi:hypothetical protein